MESTHASTREFIHAIICVFTITLIEKTTNLQMAISVEWKIHAIWQFNKGTMKERKYEHVAKQNRRLTRQQTSKWSLA